MQQAILSVTGRRSEFDAGGHESTQLAGSRLSPHPQVIAHHRGSGGERRDTVTLFGRGAAIPFGVDAQHDVIE